MTIKITESAAVDQAYHWRQIDKDTPRGVKLQLINRRYGVAVYGTYQPGAPFTHWAPLPKFKE